MLGAFVVLGLMCSLFSLSLAWQCARPAPHRRDEALA
jgi:hypothetical protein